MAKLLQNAMLIVTAGLLSFSLVGCDQVKQALSSVTGQAESEPHDTNMIEPVMDESKSNDNPIDSSATTNQDTSKKNNPDTDIKSNSTASTNTLPDKNITTTNDSDSSVNQMDEDSNNSSSTAKADMPLKNEVEDTQDEAENYNAHLSVTNNANQVDTSDTQANPNPKQAISGNQVTKVEYKNDVGQDLKAVYQTSANGDLSVIVTLQNGQSIPMKANFDGGNNPVYSSADGVVELVTHGGGGSVSLIINGESLEFEAVSAEAEVVASM